MKSIALRIVFPILVISLLTGCAGKPRAPETAWDTPEHHFLVGTKALDENDTATAAREFDLALSLDPKFGPASAGKGLLLAMEGKEKDGLKLIDRGYSDSEKPEDKIHCLTFEIRAYQSLGKQNILDTEKMISKSERVFKKAVGIDPNAPTPYFYMGETYYFGLEFKKAEETLIKVVGMKKGLEDKADTLLIRVQKAVRAAPRTTIGKKIALVDKITRADMSALLVEELDAKRFYTRTQTPEVSKFEPPKPIEEPKAAPIAATDLAGHPLRTDAETAVKLGIKGLEVFPDATFRPNTPLTKAEAAMILEDVIMRATGNSKSSTQYIGTDSPFPDVRSDQPYFNAAMFCVQRGIFASDLKTGNFLPLSNVEGSDALLAIAKIRDELRLF